MRTALRIALTFAVIFGCYMAFAGWSARSIAGDNLAVLQTWQFLRGFAAIGAATVLVFVLVVFYAKSRQDAEWRLKNQLEDSISLFEKSPLPTWIFDAESLQILAVNDAAVDEYGYSRRTLLSSLITIFHAEETHDEVIAYNRRLPAAVRSSQWIHQREGGTSVLVEIISSPITFASREARIAISRDLEQRELVESAMKGLLAAPSSGETREIDSATFFSGIVDKFFASSEKSNLKLNLDAPTSLPKKMIFDEGRLGCILEILIGEAVKFSTTGAIILQVRVLSGSPAMLQLVISEVETAEDRYRFKAPGFPAGQGRRHGFWSSLGVSLIQRLGKQLGAEIQITRDQARCEFTILLPGEINASGVFVSGPKTAAGRSV